MQLKPVALLLVTDLAHVKAAAIAARNETELVILHEKIVESGVLKFLGIPSLVPADWDWDQESNDAPLISPRSLERCCGTNQIHCSNVNQAPASTFRFLIDVLREYSKAAFPIGVRAVGAESGGAVCYTAFNVAVPGMVIGYLINAARLVVGNCVSGSVISGWASDVNLNGVYANQRVSNRNVCFKLTV